MMDDWERLLRDKGDLSALGLMVQAIDGFPGDRGAAFPASDAADLQRGARFIPGEVTLARRRGEKVRFVTDCGECCWYWEYERPITRTQADGTVTTIPRTYHYDPFVYDQIGRHNHGPEFRDLKVLAGPCPHCGNERTNGGPH